MSAATRSYTRYFSKLKEVQVSVWVEILWKISESTFSSGGSCVWKTENLGRQWQHGSDIHWNTIVPIRRDPIEPHIGRPDRYRKWPKGTRIHSEESKKTSQLASGSNCIGGVDKLLQLKVSAEWSIFVMIGCITLLFHSSYPNVLSVNICAVNLILLRRITECFPNIKSLDADWDGEKLHLGEPVSYPATEAQKN